MRKIHKLQRTDPNDVPDSKELDAIAAQVRRAGKDNERLFKKLIDNEQRFRSLARAVWKVQENERRRLARELHDSIGQTLVGLIHQLERLENRVDEDQPLLTDIKGLARNALDETRELSRLLRPPVLDDLGLEAALAWLLRTLRERSGLRARLECRLDSKLDSELETLVFRVVQEALNNVVRHAAGATVDVHVEQSANALRVRIADTGPGFDSNRVLNGTESNAGSGLRGMHDRVQLFGGRMHVRSGADQGTQLDITVPLD